MPELVVSGRSACSGVALILVLIIGSGFLDTTSIERHPLFAKLRDVVIPGVLFVLMIRYLFQNVVQPLRAGAGGVEIARAS